MSTKPRTTEQSAEDCTTSNLTSQSRAPERLWSRTFITIVALTLCCFLVGQGTNAGTSVYLDRMGETATLAGIGAAVFSAAAAVSRLLCGPIIDRKGRAIVMATGAAHHARRHHRARFLERSRAVRPLAFPPGHGLRHRDDRLRHGGRRRATTVPPRRGHRLLWAGAGYRHVHRAGTRHVPRLHRSCGEPLPGIFRRSRYARSRSL